MALAHARIQFHFKIIVTFDIIWWSIGFEYSDVYRMTKKGIKAQ